MPSTALIVHPSYSIKVADRLYPLAWRKEEPAELPPYFTQWRDEFVGDYQFWVRSFLHSRPMNRQEMFNSYALFHHKMLVIQNGLLPLARATWKANTHTLDTPLKDQLWRRIQGEIGVIALDGTHALRAEQAALPEDQLRAFCITSVKHQATSLMKEAVRVLETLVELEVAGLIEWKGNGACNYHFFLDSTDRRVLHVRSQTQVLGDQEMTTRERDVRMTHRHARYQHDLCECQVWPIVGCNLPPRVACLRTEVCEPIKSRLHVVTGRQIFESVTEEVHIEDKTERTVTSRAIVRPDPCIILGNFVLAGWADE